MGIKSQVNQFGLKIFLQLAALIVVVGMFLKSVIDIDSYASNIYQSYDSWTYHLPFAARIWRIVTPEMYLLENHEQYRFDGFPLLIEFFQGFFWFITQHLPAANLACFLSLILYCVFLWKYLQVPLYLSAIALLAVPLVQIHATSCYVDLPGNLFLSTLILLTYLLYVDKNTNNTGNIILLVLVAAGAVNTKFQLTPLVFIVLCFALPRIIWLRWQAMPKDKKLSRWLLGLLPVIFLATLLIFATPLKNTIIYGNPFYPVRIEILGQVLNHKLGLYKASPGYLENASNAQRWLYSILEINAPEWSIDQFSNYPDKTRMGGFFNAYVVFNLLLIGYTCLRHRCRQTRVALIFVGVMSAVAAFSPQSHELRYYIYWMTTLISVNLFLVTFISRASFKEKPRGISLQKPGLLNGQNLGIMCLFFLAVVITKTDFVHVKPDFYTLDKYIQDTVWFETLEAIQPEDRVCLVNRQPHTFLYVSKFHPDLKYSYLIKAAGNHEECQEYKNVL